MVMTVGSSNPLSFGYTDILPPVRSDTLPENTRYKDDGCEAAASCLDCPLALCKYDDPGWLQRESRRTRDDEIFRLREEHVSVAKISERFGISTRTVHRIVQRGGASPVPATQEDDGPIISLSELTERSLFRERTPFPKLLVGSSRRFGVN
ncbi:MAG: helix-turn-helix domain-containing protein [Chloroflexi bacterium]|nr:helix-turn-helix domain-containing protein [Chloroflexota bacterium]MBT6707492.1 helix-turn-helix domain-containing protein [Chloroflexota bacterium]